MDQIKPIRTESDYEAALATIDKYFDAAAGSREADIVEILVVLVEDYERKHYPISLPDPIEALLYLIETRGLDRKSLEPFIGSRGRVSEILNKQRPLTMEMVRKLHRGLNIPLEILMQKYMDEPTPKPRAISVSAPIGSTTALQRLSAKGIAAKRTTAKKQPRRQSPVVAAAGKHR